MFGVLNIVYISFLVLWHERSKLMNEISVLAGCCLLALELLTKIIATCESCASG